MRRWVDCERCGDHVWSAPGHPSWCPTCDRQVRRLSTATFAVAFLLCMAWVYVLAVWATGGEVRL